MKNGNGHKYIYLSDQSKLISKLRLVKSETELNYIRKAAELADEALKEAWNLSHSGINESDIFDLEIYPNPASDLINVNANLKINEIKIYNTLGELLVYNNVQNKNFSIEINELKPGIYFLELLNENGIAETKSIMVQ